MKIPAKIQQELTELRRSLEHHNRLYYTLDTPEIPDADYDAMFDRLREIERNSIVPALIHLPSE